MNWRDRYYESGYLQRWHLSPPSPAQLAEAQAFLELAGIGNNALILDLGCGHGRYSIGLARVGARVVSLDASRALLQRAQSHARDGAPPIRWVRGDMRRLPLRAVFDLVIMIDAFGYFDTEAEDIACLHGIRGVLRPGGALLMRNPNAAWIRNNFEPEQQEHRNGRTITIQSTFDAAERWIDQVITIRGSDSVEEFQRRARVYTAGELDDMLARAGFAGTSHFAGPDGAVFQAETSGRILTVCRATV